MRSPQLMSAQTVLVIQTAWAENQGRVWLLELIHANRVMVDPDGIETATFLFPRDSGAEEALRKDVVDERTWIDAVSVPFMMEHTLRGPRIRKVLREAGITTWPKGELNGDTLLVFLQGLKDMRTQKAFFKDEIDAANKIISLFERSVTEGRCVWLNF